jgi:hypothetical protein
MSKSYKSFIKEYSMGLQVPSTSYMKPIGDLISGKPLRKKESRGPGTQRDRGGLRSIPTRRGDAIPIDLPLKGEKPAGLVPSGLKKLLNLELDKEDEKR